jgi:hypothetical protein
MSGVALVRPLLEETERRVEDVVAHAHELNRGAFEQPLAHLHRRGVKTAGVQVGDHLVEDVRTRNEPRQPLTSQRPLVLERPPVVLVGSPL